MDRMSKLRVAAGLVAVVVLAASCSDSKESDGGSSVSESAEEAVTTDSCRTIEYEDVEAGGEFVDYAQLSSAADNTSFDPAAVQTLPEAQITNALFDGLLDFDFTDTCNPVLKPLVAEKWEANDDATEFVFTLKADQEFSNGEPILPSNFKKAWERAGSQELGATYAYLMEYIEGGAELNEGTATELSGVVADDEAMTLTVTLAAPLSDFPSIVTFNSFSPISNEDLDRLGNTTGWGTDGASIGNGPFKLESADSPDSGEVVLVPNESWAGNVNGDTEVKLDKLTFKLTSDVENSYQAFDSGEGDTASIAPGKYKEAAEKYNSTADEPIMGSYFLDFGFADEQLGGEENLKLRQAISMAIDREEINRKVFEGSRVISTGIVPPGVPGFSPDLCEFCATDADAAKAAFDEWTEAGGSLDTPISLSFNPGGGHNEVMAIVQANLQDVLGIETELNPVEEDYFKVIAEEGACQICRSGWYADYPTYGNFMVDLFGAASIGSNNFGRYDDAEFEDLIAKALAETDEDARAEYYQNAEKRLLNETVGAIPLNWYTGTAVYRDGVVNFVTPPLGLIAWEYVGKTA